MYSAGIDIADLKVQIQADIDASNELQARLNELRQNIKDGYRITDVHAIEGMESEAKQMLKDVMIRIERIEEQPSLNATGREMLQALNGRQVVLDKQTMQLAEMRDLTYEARGGAFTWKDVVEPEKELGPGEKARMYRKKKSEPAAAHGAGPLFEDMSTPVVEAKLADVPNIGSVAEPVVPGTAAYADSEFDRYMIPEEYDDDALYDDEEQDEEQEPEPKVDKSDWKLYYRILDISPHTDAHYWEDVLEKAHRKLQLQHDPKRWPNDPEAPFHWAAITKAYETLKDADRKQYYDMHGNTAAGLEDIDLSKLHISE